ncbi:ABC transporter permease [uncultured Imperialibacter sp.]|uniref:ABC transporter permease n=1 Tax=uncultured Imperialibacter sp. TaxID=1672639 RepID=UPI0030D9FA63|tara:strand:- start:13101 stop:15464 length:2364 start_codon:yes stop_codon:yes gene_type:complete
MHNLTAYLRFLSRYKTLSFINVFGLAIGFAACIFIGLYITEELSYDQYHEKLDRIYVVTSQINSGESITKVSTAPGALTPMLKQDFPEVEEAVRTTTMTVRSVKYGSNIFQENNILQADPEIFHVLTFPLIEGDPGTALAAPNSIVLTKTLANKYFGAEQPMGKVLTINEQPYQVTGLMNDIPTATDLKFTALVSMDSQAEKGWFDFEYHTYVLLKEQYLQSDPALISFKERMVSEAEKTLNELLDEVDLTIAMPVESLSGVHFREPTYDDTPKGNMAFISIIASVALFMLVIGSINFINFSLVQSLERGREVGIRKIVGARFPQLVFKYLSESVLIALMAFLISLTIVVLAMPLFNEITGKSFEAIRLFNLIFLSVSFATVVLVGVLAGSFPAFFTSSIQPLQALKGKITGIRGQWFRKASILVQFAIAMGLIICTLLIHQQMRFMSNYDMGFRKENVVVIDTPDDSLAASGLNVFKQVLLRNSAVEKVSGTGYGAIPDEEPRKGTLGVKPNGESRLVNVFTVDADYLPTLDVALLEGRNFDASRPGDKHTTAIVNTAFAQLWGWDDPLSEQVHADGSVKVIGVMKDFYFQSLHVGLEPTIIMFGDDVTVHMLVRFRADYPVADQMPLLEQEWKKLFPNDPFSAHFLDQSLAAQYDQEDRALTLFTSFSVLTIMVSCLGLFGLCSLTISQRKKEVGVRKIIGASYGSIVRLFSREYLVLIGLSFVIIAPVCFWLVSQWLQSFALRDSISPWVFVAACLGVLALGVATVVLSIGKTWNANPASLIRD